MRPRLGAEGKQDAHASSTTAKDAARDAAGAMASGAGAAAGEPMVLLDEDDASTGDPFY